MRINDPAWYVLIYIILLLEYKICKEDSNYKYNIKWYKDLISEVYF